MGQSAEMNNAITAFKKICPKGCEVKPASNPLYTLIKVSEWPALSKLHYEFKLVQGQGVYVECHIENKDLKWLGETFDRVAKDIKNIHGHILKYYLTDPPNKKWPFLRLEHGFSISEGEDAAKAMSEFIDKTRDMITSALRGKGMSLKSKTTSPQQKIIEGHLPEWKEVKAAIDDLDGAPTRKEILDKIKQKADKDKIVLKENWYEITKRNIPIWIAAYDSK